MVAVCGGHAVTYGA